jgi:DNA-binding response OmpR family regulator
MVNIVLIDDDDDLREMVKFLLQREGYKVFATGDGNLGIKWVKEENPALLITDILMPDKEGLEIINELRQSGSDLKILAVSGGGVIEASHYLSLANGLGADKVLAKPFHNSDLLKAIKELVS